LKSAQQRILKELRQPLKLHRWAHAFQLSSIYEMVYYGALSKGCELCRRRKIKVHPHRHKHTQEQNHNQHPYEICANRASATSENRAV
jgi:hypothetical protein